MNYVEHLNFFGIEAKEISCIKFEGPPTESTVGAVGLLGMDTFTGDVWKCVSEADGKYGWKSFGEGFPDTNAIPSYWDSHLSEKIAKIKSLQNEGGKDCFSFIVIADMHYGENLGKRSSIIAKHIIDECDIKYVLVLGDTGTRNLPNNDENYVDQEWGYINKMLSPISDSLLITDGNHDGAYTCDSIHFNFTPQKKYSVMKRKVGLLSDVTFDESGCGYYADDKTAKVRYIILSTHNNCYVENDDGSPKYSSMNYFRYGQSQYDLVVQALNTLEDGWSVLVASHVPLDRSGEMIAWGATACDEDSYVTAGEVECWVMADVLNAFVNKTAYAGSFLGTQGAPSTYTNYADTTSDDWLVGYRFSSGTVKNDSSDDITTFIGDGATPLVGKTIYYKNVVPTTDRIGFYDANKNLVYMIATASSYFPDKNGFDGETTEGHIVIPFVHEDMKDAVYVRLSVKAGATNPIITVGEPIEESGEMADAVSVSVDFSEAKGELIGYFGGHVHKDMSWGTTFDWAGRLKRCDFRTITTRCDSACENDSTLRAERVAGTVTEQSFDVFTVNKKTRTITATKIGAGDDREILY